MQGGAFQPAFLSGPVGFTGRELMQQAPESEAVGSATSNRRARPNPPGGVASVIVLYIEQVSYRWWCSPVSPGKLRLLALRPAATFNWSQVGVQTSVPIVPRATLANGGLQSQFGSADCLCIETPLQPNTEHSITIDRLKALYETNNCPRTFATSRSRHRCLSLILSGPASRLCGLEHGRQRKAAASQVLTLTQSGSAGLR